MSDKALSTLTDGVNIKSGDIAYIVRDGNSRRVTLGSQMRRKLTASETFYVRTDGDDANDGSANTSAAAFATLQGAWNYISRWIDLGDFIATIKLADGTYSGELRDLGKPLVGGYAIIEGNTSTPASVVLSANSDDCIEISTSYVEVDSVMLVNSGGSGLHAYRQGVILGRNLNFGACSEYHVFCDNQGQVVLVNYTISDDALIHWYAHSGGYINCIGRTVTLSGTPDFASGFARVFDGGIIEAIGNTYSGSATGVRFGVAGNGNITTSSATLTEFPGNAAGFITSGCYSDIGGPEGAKVWAYVLVTGGVPSIADIPTHNVTSITDGGVGLLTLTIANDFANAVFATLVSAGTGNEYFASVVSKLAGQINVAAWVSNTAALVDPASYNIAAFGKP